MTESNISAGRRLSISADSSAAVRSLGGSGVAEDDLTGIPRACVTSCTVCVRPPLDIPQTYDLGQPDTLARSGALFIPDAHTGLTHNQPEDSFQAQTALQK